MSDVLLGKQGTKNSKQNEFMEQNGLKKLGLQTAFKMSSENHLKRHLNNQPADGLKLMIM
jgi:hypothetical protein